MENTENLFSLTSRSMTLPVYNWYVREYKTIPSECIVKKLLDAEKILEKYESNIVVSTYGQNDDGEIILSTAIIKLDEEGTILYVSSINVSGLPTPKLEKKKSFYGTILFKKKVSELKDILDSFTYADKVKRAPDEVYVYLLSRDAVGYYLKPVDNTYKKVDLDLNYNDDLKKINKTIIAGLKSKKTINKGLVLLHGIPGSGKTTYIRHIIRSVKNKKFVIIPTNLIPMMTEPSFLDFLTRYNDLVLIIEEAEQALTKRDKRENSSISNILNMTDGLLGDCLNFKVISTFNTDLDNIDDALLRKGRLLAKYEFKELDKEKAGVLKEKIGAQEEESNLLADIYNFNDTNFSNKKTNKIGFVAR